MSNKLTETERLLGEIEAFLRRTGMRASTFGHRTANDGKLVDRLRNGRTITLETAAAIRTFIANHAAAVDSQPRAQKKVTAEAA